ncbi:MAG: hypothetical protein LBF12_04115 [Christensenellaceae bacterium]|nr:hypothetical protein [Christensenellaceae bacterium]
MDFTSTNRFEDGDKGTYIERLDQGESYNKRQSEGVCEQGGFIHNRGQIGIGC